MAARLAQRALGAWIASTALVAGVAILVLGDDGDGRLAIATADAPVPAGADATRVGSPITAPVAADDVVVVTTSTPGGPTTTAASIPPTTTLVSEQVPTDPGVPYGDPTTEIPERWAELCIPGTWVPETHQCTFKPSHLVGVATDPSGRPVAGICIGALELWSRSDESGGWSAEVSGFSDVVVDVWDCGSGSPFGFQPQRVPLTFAVDRTTSVSVVVAPFGGVRGRVLDEGRRPVAGACVASGGRQDLPPVGPTGTDGRFELTGVAPGDHQLFLAPCPGAGSVAGLDVAPPVVRTRPGEWADVDLAIQVGAGL